MAQHCGLVVSRLEVEGTRLDTGVEGTGPNVEREAEGGVGGGGGTMLCLCGAGGRGRKGRDEGRRPEVGAGGEC